MNFLKHSLAVLFVMVFIIPQDGLGDVGGRYQCYLSSDLEDHSESFDLVIRHEPIGEKIRFRTHISHTTVGFSLRDSFFQDVDYCSRTQFDSFDLLFQSAEGRANAWLRFNPKTKVLIYFTSENIWNCYQRSWLPIDGDSLLPSEPDDISSDSLTEIDVFTLGKDADGTSSDTSTEVFAQNGDSSSSNSSIEVEVEPQVVRNGSDRYFRCPHCNHWDYTLAPVKRHMKNCF